ncbi:hypothetical protein [Candidatus Palauibacter sp.]|uniref:hypothetical protein n=1 Tax=Candidatus Palauibacter sp. TaxID=3101350 RepID=UPI003B5C91C5
MCRGTRGIAVAVVGILAFSPGVQAQAVSDSMLVSVDRFSLFADCSPVMPFVSVDTSHRLMGGELGWEMLQGLAEYKLRVAGLFDLSRAHEAVSLVIRVELLDGAYSASVEFSKRLYDAISDERGSASTWTLAVPGIHENDLSRVLLSVSLLLDRFVANYLRINGSACDS